MTGGKRLAMAGGKRLIMTEGCLGGVLVPLLCISPSPFKERGIKGVRSVNNR